MFITWLWLHRWPGLYTCLSLFPIFLGVTLSAVTEINIELMGFMAAVLATAAGVLQTTYTKATLVKTAVDPLVFHMYTSLLAVALTAPFGLRELLEVSMQWRRGEEDMGPRLHQPVTLHTLALIFVSILCHYGQNIASIYFLQHVNVLSHTVANTLKRLVIIAGSVLWFRNPVSPLNALGMGVALAGFFAYSLARHLRPAAAESEGWHQPRARKRSVSPSALERGELPAADAAAGAARDAADGAHAGLNGSDVGGGDVPAGYDHDPQRRRAAGAHEE